MIDAIARLEAWKEGHKARSCGIDIDDGYGATCWTVTLSGERLPGDPTPDSERTDGDGRWLWRGTRVVGVECRFWGGPPAVPVTLAVSGTEDVPFPGLAATIRAALDLWDRLSNPDREVFP